MSSSPTSAVPLLSNRGKSVDKVLEEADAVKRGRYAKQCKDSDVLFFTFGMDAEGRLGEKAEDTIRYFTNRLTGDQVKRDIFRRYWTRRIVVGVLSQQMRLVLNRQKRRSPRHSEVADLLLLALTAAFPPCPAVDLWVPIAALGALCPWLACRSRSLSLLFLE